MHQCEVQPRLEGAVAEVNRTFLSLTGMNEQWEQMECEWML